jgi:TonB family protein
VQPSPRLIQYPDEQLHVRRGALAAFGLHVTLAALACLIAYWMNLNSLRDLLVDKASLASSGPAPEERIELILKADDTPPPPTNPIEFIVQQLKPQPQVIPPPPVPQPQPPKPTPPPKAQPQKQVTAKPARYTAPDALGAGESNAVSALVVGSADFPHPSYPFQALSAHVEGTVTIHVSFDSEGRASSVDIMGSSGSPILDASTRNYVLANWNSPRWAGRDAIVPVVYRLPR